MPAAGQTRFRDLPDSLMAVRVAQDTISTFLLYWRGMWQQDIASVRERSPVVLQTRIAHGHCHPRTAPDGYSASIKAPYPVITGQLSAASMCPSWLLGPPPIQPDSVESMDSALLPAHRDTVRAVRARIIDFLDATAARAPTSPWMVGQRVRLLVDQGEPARALAVAKECRAERWWCTALAGYAFERLHAYASADSAFSVVHGVMPEALRCNWTDISTLLPHGPREAYTVAPCASRDTIAARYWWLADPLLSTSVNERRAMHFARRVMIVLHASFVEDEHYHWIAQFGGDAAEEMMLRYGWPSLSVWMGTVEDEGHDNYLKKMRSPSSAPYSTAEYLPQRIHLAPMWKAIANPLLAQASDWQMNPPPRSKTSPNGRGDVWWPWEHTRLEGLTLAQFGAGQVAYFPRTGSVEFVSAFDLDAASDTVLRTWSVAGASTVLLSSTEPDSIVTIATTATEEARRVVARGRIAPHAQLLAIESRLGAQAVRTRFGADVPPALDSLRGAIALSTPVFFRTGGSNLLPSSLPQLLPRMLGSTSIARGSKIGVFWECYGIKAGGAVRFDVRVRSLDGQGFFERLASTLRLRDGGTNEVTVSFSDVRVTPLAQSADGGDPAGVLPRSLMVDVAALPRGNYSIEITATVAGQAPVHTARVLSIQ